MIKKRSKMDEKYELKKAGYDFEGPVPRPPAGEAGEQEAGHPPRAQGLRQRHRHNQGIHTYYSFRLCQTSQI